MISTRGRYALRVMIDLAEHYQDGYIPMKIIAERQNISLKYLEQILPSLTKNGMIEGLQRKGGGAGQQRALHGVEVRVEFVPEFGLPAQRDGFGQVDLLRFAADRDLLRYVQAVARDGEQRLSFERLFRAVVDLQAHVDAVRLDARRQESGHRGI